MLGNEGFISTVISPDSSYRSGNVHDILKILQNHLNFCFLKQLLLYPSMVFSNLTYIKGQFTLYLHLQITMNAPISLCEYKLHIVPKC